MNASSTSLDEPVAALTRASSSATASRQKRTVSGGLPERGVGERARERAMRLRIAATQQHAVEVVNLDDAVVERVLHRLEAEPERGADVVGGGGVELEHAIDGVAHAAQHAVVAGGDAELQRAEIEEHLERRGGVGLVLRVDAAQEELGGALANVVAGGGEPGAVLLDGVHAAQQIVGGEQLLERAVALRGLGQIGLGDVSAETTRVLNESEHAAQHFGSRCECARAGACAAE
jgi:hypothetical protein